MYTPTYIFGVPAVQANGAAAQPAEQTNRAGTEIEVRAATAVDGGDTGHSRWVRLGAYVCDTMRYVIT